MKSGSITHIATATAISTPLVANNSLGTLATITATATASLTIAFDPAAIKNKTQEIVNSFLTTRAQLILLSQPDKRRLINRLEAKAFCTGTPDVSISPGMNNVNLNASASSSTLCLGTHELDFWFETHAGYYWQRDPFSHNQGTFNVSYTGVDYLVTHAIAAGLMTELDLTSQKGTLSDLTRANGKGWMTGPYVSARIAPNVYLHMRAAWGKSNNNMTLLDTYHNHFNTGRSLYNAELNGDWQYRNWRFSPTTSFTYFR